MSSLDQIRGSLLGGAIGDALGYPVEFLTDEQIFERYGEEGITEYSLTDGIAQISDDTQMALFTVNGILVYETRLAMGAADGKLSAYVGRAYQDWLFTQEVPYELGKAIRRRGGGSAWLLDVPALYASRAPGGTCLSALRARCNGYSEDFLKHPINDSKGCGAIMRIAPLGLCYNPTPKSGSEALQRTAAEISAITHGHSLGYMPSAVLAHILNQIVDPPEDQTLKEMIVQARDTACRLFCEDPHIDELKNLIDYAIFLSENDSDDLENIRRLGEGWVAEETLAIALYCSLRHQNDFSKGVCAAVNHSGDSDSTGVVTGNILGALLGYEKIEEKWKNKLELKDVLLEMADDLCRRDTDRILHDPQWVRKYAKNQW